MSALIEKPPGVKKPRRTRLPDGLDLAVAFPTEVLPLLERELYRSTVHHAGLPPGLEEELRQAVGIPGGGGRRWRPLLSLAAARACGGDLRDALGVAVAVELTHTASLVLDDLPCMDDADERRGASATHRRVGLSGAILLAVGLLARSAELLGQSSRSAGELAGVWGRCFGLSGMAGGQAVDLLGTFRHGGCARRLHRRKTTDLAAFAVWGGAAAAGAGAATQEALWGFGEDLGWAYQLADDARDLDEDAALGKAPGGRRPAAQSIRLLGRARRRLRQAPGLSPDGVALLAGLGCRIVGDPGRVPELQPGGMPC
ncbi:MAG: hypothetical protein EA422_05385 [Gemmatimonadales bacterium]|nr:MAG: hypothetical protein EA422_05385 [Gemmatimonadales bacterium]